MLASRQRKSMTVMMRKTPRKLRWLRTLGPSTTNIGGVLVWILVVPKLWDIVNIPQRGSSNGDSHWYPRHRRHPWSHLPGALLCYTPQGILYLSLKAYLYLHLYLRLYLYSYNMEAPYRSIALVLCHVSHGTYFSRKYYRRKCMSKQAFV